METKLTLRQAEVLEYIKKYISKYGMPPTIQEIADGFGFRSASSAKDHVIELRRKGYIGHRRGKARGILLLSPANEKV